MSCNVMLEENFLIVTFANWHAIHIMKYYTIEHLGTISIHIYVIDS